MPCMCELPCLASKLCSIRSCKEGCARVRTVDGILPQDLFLSGGKQERKFRCVRRIKRVFIETVNECRNRQDIGRLPDSDPPADLGFVEPALKCNREPSIRGYYCDAGSQTRGKVRKNIRERNLWEIQDGDAATGRRYRINVPVYPACLLPWPNHRHPRAHLFSR